MSKHAERPAQEIKRDLELQTLEGGHKVMICWSGHDTCLWVGDTGVLDFPDPGLGGVNVPDGTLLSHQLLLSVEEADIIWIIITRRHRLGVNLHIRPG